MIVPMKKISLVVLDKHREESLKKLREIGVLHLEQKKVSSNTLTKLVDRKAEIESALTILGSYKVMAKAAKKISPRPGTSAVGKRAADYVNHEGIPFTVEGLDGANRKDLVHHVLELGDSRKALLELTANLSREKTRIQYWGDFSPADLEFLKNNGIVFYFYEFTPSAFKSLPRDISCLVAGRSRTTVYVLVLDKEIPGKSPFAPGEHSLSEINRNLSEIHEELASIEKHLLSIFFRKTIIEKELRKVRWEIEFETANSGMETLENVSAESNISWIYGFAPSETLGMLKRAAAGNGWALAFDDPAPGDKPPTLTRNNSVIRIIKPLFSFLGTVPGYREYDISTPFFLFFSLYFAMIFGDAAYGLILLAASAALGIKLKSKDGKLPDLVKLAIHLSCCTIVWGIITGSWFSIPHEKLPFFLRALIIPPFNNTGPLMEFPLFLKYIFRMPEKIPVNEFKTRWYIQFICFAAAVLQTSLGRAIRIKRILPSLEALAHFGWLLIMVGMYFIVLLILLKIPLPPFVFWCLVAGASLVLVFGEQKGGNFFANVLKGLSGLFSTFLKVVGCFADILSYIRLFAVALAGTMVAGVFNSLAIPADGLGKFGLVFLLKLIAVPVILIFGHGLNVALNFLGVVVHGVRLNLLEFAGNHLEMEWSGYEYDPFALKQKNK